MPERGLVKLDIDRGASVVEFGRFLADLEHAYLAIYSLPSLNDLRRPRRRFLIDYLDLDLLDLWPTGHRVPVGGPVYPDDQLAIARISIQSPGWVELIGSLNPLQQLREYLKDRHERAKDKEWRSAAERDKAYLELEILRTQAERERVGAISDFYELLERMELTEEERQRILWDRLGGPMMRLGQHQDSGLLGDQRDENKDKGEE